MVVTMLIMLMIVVGTMFFLWQQQQLELDTILCVDLNFVLSKDVWLFEERTTLFVDIVSANIERVAFTFGRDVYCIDNTMERVAFTKVPLEM